MTLLNRNELLPQVEQLVTTYWLVDDELPHHPPSTITVNLTGLQADSAALAREAMQNWEAVADINFVEVSGPALATFTEDEEGAYSGSAYGDDGITIDAFVNVGRDTIGPTRESDLRTWTHEIGHLLGLGHGGNYNGEGEDIPGTAWDSYALTLMSYLGQDENATPLGATPANPMTPMLVDILAVQSIFGASTRNSGDTTYALDLANRAMAIFDPGGVDTLGLGASTTNDAIDLRPGSVSDVFGEVANFGIAWGTVIEKVNAGAGNDHIRGNGAANRIAGGTGDDIIFADGGRDKLLGGAGDDILRGGAGRDILNGGPGADVFYVNRADNVVGFQRGIDRMVRTDSVDPGPDDLAFL